MKHKITMRLLLAFLSLNALATHAQTTNTNTTTASPKATATLAATCTIDAQNVNFGVISLPVGAQSATSSMTVQCTKGSSFTIGLAYGGIYGQGTGSVIYQNVLVNANPTGQNGAIYKVVNSSTGATYANYSVKGTPGVNFTTICSGLGGTLSGNNCTVGTAAYNYGKLIGTAHGDALGYSIQIPGDSSKVWNSGNYSYTTTATGINQSIPVVATLQSGQTANAYPTADTYLDIVTATITY